MDVLAEGRETVLAAGDAVAGLYAALLTGARLPDGWIADVQHLVGLWIRPTGPADVVVAERAEPELIVLPEAPVRGLVVVGMRGRAVPPEVWEAVRQALEQVPEPDRAALSVHAIDAAPAAHHLADLVAVRDTVTLEAPGYPDEPWHVTAHPADH